MLCKTYTKHIEDNETYHVHLDGYDDKYDVHLDGYDGIYMCVHVYFSDTLTQSLVAM